eukprot:SAG11_NODE_4591_length_1840_cov_2.064331_2_plen_140_part_00
MPTTMLIDSITACRRDRGLDLLALRIAAIKDDDPAGRSNAPPQPLTKASPASFVGLAPMFMSDMTRCLRLFVEASYRPVSHGNCPRCVCTRLLLLLSRPLPLRTPPPPRRCSQLLPSLLLVPAPPVVESALDSTRHVFI